MGGNPRIRLDSDDKPECGPEIEPTFANRLYRGAPILAASDCGEISFDHKNCTGRDNLRA
jgi:hypothetical protein